MLYSTGEFEAECPPDMSQYAAIDLAFCHSWNPSGRTRAPGALQREDPMGEPFTRAESS